MMKRKLTAAFVGVIAAAALGAAVNAGPAISIVIDGETVQTDTPPQITAEGRTIVPLRVISETMGANVIWEQEEKKVTAEKNGRILELKIGDKTIYNDGEPMEIDSPAQIVNGRTMVPVRVISESFGCQVGWDGDTKTFYVTTFPEDGGDGEYGEEEFEEFTSVVTDMPKYEYHGDAAHMKTICDYLIDYTKDRYDKASVTIPVFGAAFGYLTTTLAAMCFNASAAAIIRAVCILKRTAPATALKSLRLLRTAPASHPR